MDKDTIFSITTTEAHGRGYVYSLQYHIVWCTKYRKPILEGDIAKDVRQYIHETMDSLDASILAMDVMSDHVHLLVDAKPQFRPSDAVKVLKGNTARWLFMAHPGLKNEVYGGHLWNPNYFICTISGQARERVEHYISSQQTGGSLKWR